MTKIADTTTIILQKSIQKLIYYFGLCVYLTGFYILVFLQVVPWLKSGEWSSLPLLIIFSKFFSFIETKLAIDLSGFKSWLDDPTSYYGLHKIVTVIWDLVISLLEFIPISLAVIAIGLYVTAIGSVMEDTIKDKIKIRSKREDK